MEWLFLPRGVDGSGADVVYWFIVDVKKWRWVSFVLSLCWLLSWFSRSASRNDAQVGYLILFD